MANRYSAAGRTVATAASANAVACGIHNDHATKSIYVREFWLFTTTATTINLGIQRATTKGTVVTSVAHDADNAFDRRAAAPSGCTVILDYSADPTLTANYMFAAISAAQIGAGWVFGFPEAVEVPAGTGLVCCTTQAAAFPVCDFTAVWDE
jgi:hypothetical protein